MPTYDYECREGHRFEVFQKMSDAPVAECPECGAEARRLISGGAGFLFKGEGFYITDYRSEEYKKKASSEPGSGAESTTTSSSEGSTAKGGSDAKGGEASSGGGSSGSDSPASGTSSSSSSDS